MVEVPVQPWPRAIVHVDMDAFFASVEVRDNPELKGRPVAVGGSGARGVIATASYEARAFGVHSAMPTSRALTLCPQLILIPGRHSHYAEVSREIMDVLDSFSPIRESVSLDEAYLDITGVQRLHGSPRSIAYALRRAVWDRVRLTCSVGGGISKSVAKIASGRAKPHGIEVVEPHRTLEFLAPLPVSAIGGVGPVAQKKLESLGVRTVSELREVPLTTLTRALGSAAAPLLELAHGKDLRPVGRATKDRSVGKERTFDTDIAQREKLRALALSMADDVSYRLRASHLAARSVAVKLRAPDGKTITRSMSFHEPTNSSEVFRERALAVFERAVESCPVVRLLGIRAEHVVDAPRGTVQGDLEGRSAKWDTIDRALDSARSRFGSASVSRASTVDARGARMKDGVDEADDAPRRPM